MSYKYYDLVYSSQIEYGPSGFATILTHVNVLAQGLEKALEQGKAAMRVFVGGNEFTLLEIKLSEKQ